MPSANLESPGPPEAVIVPSGRLARAREKFISAGAIDTGGVRQIIAASWSRSRDWKVAADQIELPYVRDPDPHVPLVHSAGPVLKRLTEQTADSAVSIILTDAQGVVLDRRTGDPELRRELDRVQLAPGFSYAEQFVGTNGIGTALEGGQATGVFGHEHYASNLESLGCAGVPVRHPLTGRLLGVLDLTCWSEDAGPLLLALARNTAQHIERELVTHTGLRETALLHAYLKATRRPGRIVFALTTDVVMMNDHARDALTPADQAALLACAAESAGPLQEPQQRGAVDEVELPSGTRARLARQVVYVGSTPVGAVVEVRLCEPDPAARTAASPAGIVLPGVAGSSPAWRRACDETDRHYTTGQWVTVRGEAGTGKLALLRAVHLRHDPAGRFRVLDAEHATRPSEFLAAVQRELRDRPSTLVLRHIDRLSPAAGRALTAVLQQARQEGARNGHRHWIAATHTLALAEEQSELLGVFAGTVEAPALRHRIEDLPELVPYLLRSLSSATNLTCSPAALQLLMRNAWPGNVTALRSALATVVQHRRTGAIQPDDLPAHCRSATRRVLSPLEAMERDAIVQSLINACGSRSGAATALGMSRATIYRKIREYGIDLPR
ncbi:MAG TPA: GAF domain-containing protein [Actinocrinis sp.]|uniref:sigma-54-dependent Fis family transcriptional regulator n=1 Tax=Actinocrinis sp. TaxID=1920516 RepID=UPI002DDC8FC1|nr:GAF domain-containing protein [Actinocrinis sp.]HEV2346183.1 GAF domain-containing protein [Actinocrinis sp.]